MSVNLEKQTPNGEEQSGESTTDYAGMMQEAQGDVRPGEEGRIQDPVKAEIMAHASAGEEEKVVAEKAIVKDKASKLGEGGYNTADYDARQAIERAQKARVQADNQANKAGEYYDSVNNL